MLIGISAQMKALAFKSYNYIKHIFNNTSQLHAQVLVTWTIITSKPSSWILAHKSELKRKTEYTHAYQIVNMNLNISRSNHVKSKYDPHAFQS